MDGGGRIASGTAIESNTLGGRKPVGTIPRKESVESSREQRPRIIQGAHSSERLPRNLCCSEMGLYSRFLPLVKMTVD